VQDDGGGIPPESNSNWTGCSSGFIAWTKARSREQAAPDRAFDRCETYWQAARQAIVRVKANRQRRTFFSAAVGKIIS